MAAVDFSNISLGQHGYYNHSKVLDRLADGDIPATPTEPCGVNLTGGSLVVAKLFDRNCVTSIPMGIGTGVFIFIVVIIVVNHLMNREQMSAMMPADEKGSITADIPIDCESLIFAEPCATTGQDNDLYPEVFSPEVDGEYYPLLVLDTNGGTSSKPQITLTRPVNSSYANEVV